MNITLTMPSKKRSSAGKDGGRAQKSAKAGDATASTATQKAKRAKLLTLLELKGMVEKMAAGAPMPLANQFKEKGDGPEMYKSAVLQEAERGNPWKVCNRRGKGIPSGQRRSQGAVR